MAEMQQDFTPVNELEEKLLALCREEIEFSLFIQILLNGKVAVALTAAPDRALPNAGIDPMTIVSPKGYTCLATFTSPERIQVWHRRAPQYQYALTVQTRWFLRGAEPTVGFALNPGWAYGFEMAPEGLVRLKRDFGMADTSK